MNTREYTITAYLDGSLTEADRTAFEAEMATDAALAAAVEEERTLRGLLGTYRAEQPEREAIQEIYAEVKAGGSGRIRRFPVQPAILLAVAAAVALLVMFWPGREPAAISAEELFAESFQPAAAPERMGQGTEAARIALEQGHISYGDSNYREAIPQYQLALTDSTTRSEAAFFISQAYLALGDYPAATAALAQVTDRVQAVRWYGALAALGQGDVAAVRRLLEPLAAEPTYDFHREAKALLGRLGEVE